MSKVKATDSQGKPLKPFQKVAVATTKQRKPFIKMGEVMEIEKTYIRVKTKGKNEVYHFEGDNKQIDRLIIID